MKAMIELANAPINIKRGNHRVEITSHVRKFFYYVTIICEVCDESKTFKIDDSYGTKSTIRACAEYRRIFIEQGYTEQK